MAKRTIRVAHWRCDKNGDGVKRLAYFGEVVDLSAAEIRRGEAAGVFTPTLPTATTAATVEDLLANADPRVALPVGAADSDAAPLHHDILSTPADLPEGVVLRQDGKDLADNAPAIAPTLVTEPVGSDPAATIQVTAPDAGKRPVNAANVETWRAYIRQARTDLTDLQIDAMTKDELKAAAPKDE